MCQLRIFVALGFGAALFAQPLSYTVASIRRDKSGDTRFMLRPLPGGRLTASGVNVKMLIMEAYQVQPYQISGGPSWITSERWDIQAKADGLHGDHSSELMQSLLADQFQLKIHRKTRKLPGYALVVAKAGPKLKASADSANAKRRGLFGFGRADVTDASMPRLAYLLSRELGRPVIDRTGLKGKYDFQLKWTPAPGEGGPDALELPPIALPAPDTDAIGPSIFTALEEQLGVELKSTKAPAKIVVIDHVERPSEN